MKLISPWRYSITFLWRCRAMAVKPMRSNSAPMRGGVGRGVLDELEAVGAHRVVPGGELHAAAPVAQSMR